MGDPPVAGRRGWIASLVVAACVAGACLVAASSLERAARITAMVGLGAAGVGISLGHTMGLRREGVAVRLIIAVPFLMSVLLVVALMLDARFRGRAAAGLTAGLTGEAAGR